MLTLIRDLIDALHDSGISYCHWKSNINLNQAVEGVDDLDLLVAEKDRIVFERLLIDCGFRQFSSARENRTRGIFNFYGYDSGSNLFVHVHTHYELVLGHDLLKNYSLPVVTFYLDGMGEYEGMPIPEPAKEYVVFVLRMVLKRRFLGWMLTGPRTWVKLLLVNQTFGLTGCDADELISLRNSCTTEERRSALAKLAPNVTEDVFVRCEASLGGSASRLGRFRAGRALTGRLKNEAIIPPWRAPLIALSRRFKGLLDRITFQAESRKKPRGGGRIFAIVGGDGSGKTTNIDNLVQWLGLRFVVRYLHYGKPPRDFARILLGAFLRLARPFIGKNDENFPDWIQAMGFVLLARDRLRAMRGAAQSRNCGEIVIMDRIHVPGLVLMDSPQIKKLKSSGSFVAWLAGIEERLYQATPQPDLHIVLRLDPEIAVLRKPEDGEVYVRTRNQQLWEVDWDSIGAFVLDGAMPLNEIKKIIQGRVWEMIVAKQKVVEILGAPGTGKSTAVRKIKGSIPTLRTRISTRAFVTKVVFCSVSKVYENIRRIFGGLPVSVVRAMFIQEIQLDLMRKRNGIEKLKYGPFLLDEGPLSGLVWVKNEAIGTRGEHLILPWVQQMALGWAEILDFVQVLDAPDHILCDRINSRLESHRIKGAAGDVSTDFLKKVRESIDSILAISESCLSFKTINTEFDSPDFVAEQVGAFLDLRNIK